MNRAIFCAFCVTTHLVFTAAANEILLMRLPLIEAKNKSAEEVLELIITEFRREHPKESGIDSFIILSHRSSDNHISLKLNNVPLGVALESVAHGLGLRVFIKDSRIAMIDSRLIEEIDTVIHLSNDVLKGLGLERPLSATAIADAIRKWKIFVDLNANIQFDDQQEYAKIHMTYAEAQKLQTMIELFNRGLRNRTDQ
jgi:hypothetical protein